MAGRSHRNIMVIGASGSGKSHFVDHELLPAMDGRYRYLVVLNTTRELSRHCNHSEYVGEQQQERSYSPEKLAALIRHHGKVHFECATGENLKRFLEALGKAVWLLGKYETPYTEVQVVIDESHLFLPKRDMPRAFARLETEGRKFGVDVLKITQTLQSTTGDTISHLAIKQVNVVFVFALADYNDRKRVLQLFPGIPDPGELQRPENGLPAEYIARDCARGKSCAQKRDAGDPRKLLAHPSWKQAAA